MKGWYNEKYRHSLAAKGIKTNLSKTSFSKKFSYWGEPYTDESPTPVMHTDKQKFLRYEPKEMDKVIFVDLDDTLADIETESDLKETLGFNLIEQLGVEEFRKAGQESRLINVDDYEARISAYEKWKAGKVPHFNLGDIRGDFYVFERPGMLDELKKLSKSNRLVLYTAAGPVYAKAVLNTLGAGDLFQDMISNEQLEGFRMMDSSLAYKEGLKPITPAAKSLGLQKGDVILVDDREDFAGGPEARSQWVHSPISIFPTENTMKDFFKKLNEKVKQLNEGKFVDEHTALKTPTGHLDPDTIAFLHNQKLFREQEKDYPTGFVSLNPKNKRYKKYDDGWEVSGPWDQEDEATKEYYRNLFAKGGGVE